MITHNPDLTAEEIKANTLIKLEVGSYIVDPLETQIQQIVIN